MRRIYSSDLAMAMGVMVALQLCGLVVAVEFIKSLG
jgi:hypothetical protein